jgi:glyoxylase-like metal-dependent hydrolase (beta-lactamase superfamily II)
MWLTKHVSIVGGGAYGLSHTSDCNVYLVDGGRELGLIDAGGGGGVDSIAGNIRGLGLDAGKIGLVVVTHCHFDHIGGIPKVRELAECRVAVHEAEARAVEKLDSELTLSEMAGERGLEVKPTKVDVVLRGGEVLRLDSLRLEVLHTPGHTPGSICVLMEDGGKRVLFSGDVVSAAGRLGFINGPGFDLAAYKRSMTKLVAREADVLLPGHGTFVLAGAHDHVKLYGEKMNAPWINVVTTLDF